MLRGILNSNVCFLKSLVNLSNLVLPAAPDRDSEGAYACAFTG